MSWSCFSKKSVETEVKIISESVTASVTDAVAGLDPNMLKDLAEPALTKAKAAAATLEATPVGAAAAAAVVELESLAKPANLLARLRACLPSLLSLRKQIPVTDEKLASVAALVSSAPAPVAALVSAVEVPASAAALVESAELQIRSIAQAETAKVIESSKAAAAGIEQVLEKATLASAVEPPKTQTE